MSERPENFLPMSDEMASFLQQIKLDPENDDLRLIFADWLEERNDPRGTLMRVQCEVTAFFRNDPRFAYVPGENEERILSWRNPQLKPLKEKENELLSLVEEWLDQPANSFKRKIRDNKWKLSRGLLHIEVDLEFDWQDHWEWLTQSEWWPWVSSLELYGVSEEALIAIGRSSHLHNLSSLRLPRCRGVGIEALATSGSCQNLSKLWLSLEGKEAASLAQSDHFLNLKELYLGGMPSGDEAAITLAASTSFPKLEHLYLHGEGLTDKGAEAIAGSKQMERLTFLYLSESVGDGGAKVIANSPYLTNLTTLYLGDSVSDEGIETLAQSVALQTLTRLTLSSSFTSPGIRAFPNSPHFKNLNGVRLSGCREFGDEGAKAIASSSNLHGLTSLRLPYCNIGDEGVSAIANSPHLQALSCLVIYENPFGAEGMKSLLHSPYLQNLHFLELPLRQDPEEKELFKALEVRFGEQCWVGGWDDPL